MASSSEQAFFFRWTRPRPLPPAPPRLEPGARHRSPTFSRACFMNMESPSHSLYLYLYLYAITKRLR